MATPTITSISPASGAVGSNVEIVGTDFGATQGASTVAFFDGVSATVLAWGATLIVVTVPEGAATGVITVTIDASPYVSESFTVVPPTRTALTPQALPGPWSTTGKALTLDVMDATNGNCFAASNKDLVLVQNTDVSDPSTLSITSTECPEGRLGDVDDVSIAAGKIFMFGPLPRVGWVQSDGTIEIDGSSTDLSAAVIHLP